MEEFAALLDALVFTTSRNRKLALIAAYLRAAPDPDRGWALAGLTGGLDFPGVKSSTIRNLMMERIDPVLWTLSRDFVGDTAETASLLWPAPEDPAPQDPLSLAEVVETDGELSVEEISLATAELMREAGPWGQGFPEPCFDQHFRIERTRIVGEKHLKLWVSPQGSARRFDAIAFNYSESLGAGQLAHLVYRLDINEYAGERRLQLIVDHVLAVSA